MLKELRLRYYQKTLDEIRACQDWEEVEHLSALITIKITDKHPEWLPILAARVARQIELCPTNENLDEMGIYVRRIEKILGKFFQEIVDLGKQRRVELNNRPEEKQS